MQSSTKCIFFVLINKMLSILLVLVAIGTKVKRVIRSSGVSMTASWTATRDATPGSSSQSPSQSLPLQAPSSGAHAQMMILPEESASVTAAMGGGGATSEDADEDAVEDYLARLSSEAEGMEDNYEQVWKKVARIPWLECFSRNLSFLTCYMCA